MNFETTPFAVVDHRVDLCVVGGGMSGLCAAVAAARRGVRTVLVHDRPMLGGNASSEVRMWVQGAHGRNLKETGVLEEIQLANLARNPLLDYSIWDSVLFEAAAFQPNLTLLLNCSCADGDTEGPVDARRLCRIRAWQTTTQTWHQVEARMFIDASGDSVLAPLSGAEVRWGREARAEFDEDIAPLQPDRRTMGNTILIQLREMGRAVPYTPPTWAWKFTAPDEFPFRVSGVQTHNFWWLELGGIQDTIHDAEVISRDLYALAWGVWDYLKNRAAERDKLANWRLEWLGTLPGKRENRRYVGDYLMTQHDVRAEGRFPDTVAYGGWSMDDHHPAGMLYPGKPTIHHPAPSPYGIPLRSLVSRNVTNLLCAGRNISVTHVALSSTRVMRTCAIIGQAAGTAAALALAKRVRPGSLYPDYTDMLQQMLLEDDCYLPGVPRDVHPLVTSAVERPDGALTNGWDRPIGEAQNGVRLSPGEHLTYTWKDAVNLGGARFCFDSNLSDGKVMPYRYGLKQGMAQLPSTLVRDFTVEARRVDGRWEPVGGERDNARRFGFIPVGGPVTGLRLRVERFWGDEAKDDPGGWIFGFEPSDRTEDLPRPPAGPSFREVQARVPAEELRPPDSGYEDEADAGGHHRKARRMHGA